MLPAEATGQHSRGLAVTVPSPRPVMTAKETRNISDRFLFCDQIVAMLFCGGFSVRVFDVFWASNTNSSRAPIHQSGQVMCAAPEV